MAWQTPVITWSSMDRVTYDDLNRIADNINYLYPLANLTANYTQNDFFSVSDFAAWTSALEILVAVSGVTADVPDWESTPEFFNELEGLIQQIYDRIELNLLQAPATIYSGDDLYASAEPENYVRGI